jgi:hypothetical protein
VYLLTSEISGDINIMLKLLIIEDSLMMQKIIKHIAATELDCGFDIAND